MKLFRKHIPELSDEELLKRYRKLHDSELIGILYNRYIHLVYGLCIKYLRLREDAQDAVMNIFEMVADKLKTHEVTHFKSWLYMVAKNHCLMQLRKGKMTENINGEFMENILMVHPDYEEHDPLENNLDLLKACMQELRADQQLCVRLFYLQHQSYQEIAAQTTFKLSKVKSYIQNGKRNLKNCLEKKYVKK